MNRCVLICTAKLYDVVGVMRETLPCMCWVCTGLTGEWLEGSAGMTVTSLVSDQEQWKANSLGQAADQAA